MARGVRGTIDDKIAKLNEKLAKKQAELDEIAHEIKELAAQKKAEQVQQVLKIAEDKGMSMDDILEAINK